MKDIFLTDYNNKHFKDAFKIYFDELGIKVDNWEELYSEIQNDYDTYTFLRLTDNEEIVGFVMFKCTELSNWFLNCPIGFIREFWVSSAYRGTGNGAQLLKLAENYFISKNIWKAILTTENASAFYEKFGYKKDPYIYAKNKDDVLIKTLV